MYQVQKQWPAQWETAATRILQKSTFDLDARNASIYKRGSHHCGQRVHFSRMLMQCCDVLFINQHILKPTSPLMDCFRPDIFPITMKLIVCMEVILTRLLHLFYGNDTGVTFVCSLPSTSTLSRQTWGFREYSQSIHCLTVDEVAYNNLCDLDISDELSLEFGNQGLTLDRLMLLLYVCKTLVKINGVASKVRSFYDDVNNILSAKDHGEQQELLDEFLTSTTIRITEAKFKMHGRIHF
jgi:hypothetical protein